MRIFFSAFFIILLSFSGYSQKLLTLEDAVNIALQRNTLLQKSVNSIDSYQSNVKAAYGNLLPTLGLQGNWQWTRSETKGGFLPLPNGGFLPLPDLKIISETRSYNVGAGTNWTLFDGLSSIATISQSKNNLESAQLSLARLKQTIVYQTISNYYDVINAGELLKVKEEDVKWNEKNYETINERNKLGAVTIADVYAQQVKVGNAELAVIQAKNSLETAKSNLLYYLGLDVLDSYSFSDSLSTSDKDVIGRHIEANYQNLSDLVTKSLSARYDYQSAKLSLESALNGITIARGGYFPSLTNNNSFYTYSDNVNTLFQNRNYTVALTLNIPIFSGFSTENRLQLAEVSALNSKADLSDLERDIKRNIQKTYLDLQAAEKSLDVSKGNVEAAEESRRIQQEKYALGSSTLLDVLVANSDYLTAQTNLINAEYAYIVLSEQVKYQLGVLDYKKYE
ncbi:MAG: TolC family protein [Ignavibacteriaceae bacterium]|nr:TolC family protein [Ignavibacteriaceae bacterium]